MNQDRYLPIGDYAFLSDCKSTALVSSEGSIDWACLRRFDSGSTFGRLLDADRGGYFSIRPVGEIIGATRRYLSDTLVLETTMTTESGSIRCTDALAMSHGGAQVANTELLRRVECIDGSVEIEIVIAPRFDYGATRPWLRHHGDGRYTAVGGDEAVIIHSTADFDLDRECGHFTNRMTLDQDGLCDVTLFSSPAHLVDTSDADVAKLGELLEETISWWKDWSSDTDVDGDHAELLNRSAMVLKGLTCAPTGAVVAAATTSLPEVPGGEANWDYRYSWIRDSSVALVSLAQVGHPEVAQGFRDFVMRSSAGSGDELQIMYGPYGERSLPERELDLEGWRGSAPVRVGNAAATQTQLDVYGHLLETAHLWHTRGGTIDNDEWTFLSSVVNQAAARRGEPDSGMWEMRGPSRHHVHSKVMIWLALDRGISLVETHGFDDGTSEGWREKRDVVRHEIETRGVDPDHGNFVQYYGTAALDASLLRLPLVGFVDANDESMRTTTDAIMNQLGVAPHGFLRRYQSDSDRDESEGVFLLCSFWLVEVLALQGRIKEANDLFLALTDVGNDLGLFSEEYDVANRELLGNFPQAFTHLGLIAAEKRLREVAASRPMDTSR